MPGRSLAFFVTCLTDQFYPRVGVAVVKVLEHLGWRVEFPHSQTCCGQPFHNGGYEADSVVLARRFIEVFEPYPYIVTPSGSCCAMVRAHYKEILAGDAGWQARAQAISNKTYDFVEFLERVEHFDPASVSLPVAQDVTYHYTCHLRSLGIRSQQADFLSRMGNLRYVPLQKADQCCGFGGVFALKFPHISGAMVEDKADRIRATGAGVTICNDAGCTMNIAGMCHRHELPTQVMHIAELLADAMGLELESL